MDHGNPGNKKALAAIYPLSDFVYQDESDTYICPAGQTLHRRRHDPIRKSTEYKARKDVCAQCPVKAQCTKAKAGRTVARHDDQELVTKARVQAKSLAQIVAPANTRRPHRKYSKYQNADQVCSAKADAVRIRLPGGRSSRIARFGASAKTV